MYRILAAALVLGLAVGSAAPAEAQLRPTLSIAGGAAMPQGGSLDELQMNTGWHAAGAVTFRVPVLPALRVEGLYTRVSSDAFNTGTTSMNLDTGIMGATANLVLGPGMMGFRPYVIAGGGMYRTKISASGSFAGESFNGSDSRTDAGVNGGLGFEMPLGGLGTFVEARYHTIFTEGERTSFVPLTFGLRF